MLGFADIARLLERIELRLIASLRRNLSAHRKEEKRLGFQWSAWQAEKLRNLDRFRRQNRQILHEYTDIIDDETRSLMLEQFDEGERLAEEQTGETESVPSSAFFGVNKDKMDSLITDITTLEKTAESAALRMVDDVYRQTLHRVQLEMGSGSMTLEQAVDVAVKDFLDKGINCIQYADGRRVNIADYVRMALRTSATRATLQGQAKRLTELGYDTVATTSYGGCSETCEPWQGRAYIDNVFTPWDGERQLIGGVLHGRSHYCGKWFPLLSEATGSGLFHPNCRHGLTVYIDGRTELPKPIPAAEIKAQREREETQRRMEREIRKLKRFAAGTLDPDSAKAYRRKLREAQQELRLFIEQENATEGRTVLRRKYEREKVYEGDVYSERGITGKHSSTTDENTVDLDYIKSSEYKNKFKSITDNDKVNAVLYKQAKAALTHRNGTSKEDMWLINSETAVIEGKQTNSRSEYGVDYNSSLINAIKRNRPYTLISLHNHPTNNPPTGSDLSGNAKKKYALGVVVTHSGKVYSYKAGKKPFFPSSFDKRVDKYRGTRYNMSEEEAIIQALRDYESEYGIEWREH